ncbi:ergothioneine biosynthesis protein EgtB [Pseudoduganella chitinolytica]|uniref:Ergothioneine biosynthesis protein EgtB n=1 Tax=Pseudoduganella chitinolytica TaxID=34070 RepID=A0ABY8B758_9BURK|nr:ergothioneine biosynthesis protein EgtB [Pseudoduganella chitinolytica]WEF31556.1 ergothioneine biosynthesis protein EgtB [Pseudoduganella chitinolytica]
MTTTALPLALAQRYRDIRQHSERLCAPLAIEDHVAQPVPEVSPPKWHLGHTAWFFEATVLQACVPGYRQFDARYGFLFNSYYESQGARTARDRRGGLSRPTVAQVLAYRRHVDAAMLALLAVPPSPPVRELVEIGLQHEQQHQELLLADIKYILGTNPLEEAYEAKPRDDEQAHAEHAREPAARRNEWIECHGGAMPIGHDGPGFAFDNEGPRHMVQVSPVALRAALVTNGEYLAFMRDGGYTRFELWHAEGWEWLQSLPRRAPLYWHPGPSDAEPWQHYTLAGCLPLDLEAPVTHVSLYEAYAFCRWAGWRLPTEAEWEAVAPRLDWGRRWEWTGSAYLPYPGFRAFGGTASEYNGKFMLNQMVLRGASWATPAGHARLTYRNFFHPYLRWQYTGIRPARDLQVASLRWNDQ